jgi:prepilin-type N-terminal cleavage/methylation domain-containing protein
LTARRAPILRDQGFSLVEALIALAIIAVMTAVLTGTSIGDARERRALRERREALLLAQSALDRSYDPNTSGSGVWHGYAWRISRDAEGPPDAFDKHPLERLTVEVRADGRRVLRLATVRTRP